MLRLATHRTGRRELPSKPFRPRHQPTQGSEPLTFVILPGTLLPIDRITAVIPTYSGTHMRHGTNIEVLIELLGGCRGLARPAGSTTTLRPPPNLGRSRVRCLADVGRAVRGRRLKRWQRRYNCPPAKIRSIGEQVIWSALRRATLANRAFADRDDLISAVRRGLRQPQYCHGVLDGCLTGTGLRRRSRPSVLHYAPARGRKGSVPRSGTWRRPAGADPQPVSDKPR
ncbi:hypothetical protein GCM10027074_37460 [Streptomyces deserti]